MMTLPSIDHSVNPNRFEIDVSMAFAAEATAGATNR